MKYLLTCLTCMLLLTSLNSNAGVFWSALQTVDHSLSSAILPPELSEKYTLETTEKSITLRSRALTRTGFTGGSNGFQGVTIQFKSETRPLAEWASSTLMDTINSADSNLVKSFGFDLTAQRAVLVVSSESDVDTDASLTDETYIVISKDEKDPSVLVVGKGGTQYFRESSEPVLIEL